MLPPRRPRPAPAPLPAVPAAAPTRADRLDRVEAMVGDLVAALTPADAAARGRGRPRVLPALALWSGLVVCVLRGVSGQRARWRLLASKGLWHFPRFAVSDEAVYRRLAGGGTGASERLFADLSAGLADRSGPVADRTLAPFAAEVVAIDETALDPVARKLPALREAARGARCLLPGKLAAVDDRRRQQFRRVEHVEDPSQNEKVAARGLLAGLAAGALVLADLGSFGFAWFDDLTDRGFWWVSKLRAKTSYAVIHPFYRQGETFDGLVWLGKHRADRAKHAVRLVQFRHGATLYRSLTNVHDPLLLPMADVARLYARRWDVEMAFDLIKTELGLHLLWSAKTAVVLPQVWAVLIIAQLLQAPRLTVAAEAGGDPFEVSLPLLVEYLPRYAARGLDPVAAFVADGVALGFIRPSRRTRILAPRIADDHLLPPPPDRVLVRTPRYAGRRCHRDAATAA
jgi:Transposase DDE domain